MLQPSRNSWIGVSSDFNKLHEHVPALRILCKSLARDTFDRSSCSGCHSGRGGAQNATDPRTIILQITSRNDGRSSLPQDHQGPPIFEVLQPAIFFLPARYWHHCENGYIALSTSPHFALNGRHLMTELACSYVGRDI
jgi:hypothetical protein